MDPQGFELCADQTSRLVAYDDYTVEDDVFAYRRIFADVIVYIFAH